MNSSFSYAAGTTGGTIVVSILNENGVATTGNWELYYGTAHKNFLVRSGRHSESFRASEGYYFLEVGGLAKSRPYFLRYSKIPQYLSGGDTVIFNMQYYKTQDVMLAATGQPPSSQVLETTVAALSTDYVYDSHGCNLTRGYAWCGRSATCTKYWTSNCQVTATSTGWSNSAVISYIPVAKASEMETSVTQIPGVVPSGRYLFATGSSVIFLLIISVLLSLGMIRRFYRRRQRP